MGPDGLDVQAIGGTPEVDGSEGLQLQVGLADIPRR